MKYDSDSHFMRIALHYAWNFQTLTLPNPCVGTLVVCNNTIIALQAHTKAGMPHAEVLACKEAFLYKIQYDDSAKKAVLQSCKQQGITHENPLIYLATILQNMQDSIQIHDFITKYHSEIFHECEFFVTLEPCNHYGKTPPCAKLLRTIKPKRIIIAHEDNTPHASGGANTLLGIDLIFGVLQHEAHALLFPFLQWQQHKGFMLFKVAHRLHGDYKHGTISNEDSRIFTHNMRCIADYIIISGATLRQDNPRLDTRFALASYAYDKESCMRKQPKILILSKTMQEDELTHYNIADKEVSIIRCVTQIPKYGFKVIEGGFAFLHSLLHDIALYDAPQIDCIMGYVAPTFALDMAIFHQAQTYKHNAYYTLAYSAMLTQFWTQKAQQNNTISPNNILYYLFLSQDKAKQVYV